MVDNNPASYDPLSDTLTIWGVKYSAELFRHLSFGPIGSIMAIVNRDDGVVTIQHLPQGGFQNRAMGWMESAFIGELCHNAKERSHRFLEESLELVQARGLDAGEAHMLVEYVFGRPAGDQSQEVGGVVLTLALLCGVAGLNMDQLGEHELERCWQNIAKIRAKQLAKPGHSG